MKSVLNTIITFSIVVLFSLPFGNAKKVLLKDVDVLTLYSGKMTTGRRSSPMPQVECVGGGSAPCSAFKPRVVQCSNRGSDGYDVQWECKTDMDNNIRFGHVDVSCEGYEYPDDPYILHGSCGLKYNLDYTKEGLNQGTHDYYGNDNSYTKGEYRKASSSSWIADVIVYAAIGLMVYAFYITCIRSQHDNAYSTTSDDAPYPDGRGSGGYGWFGGRSNPPTAPPYTGGYQDNASCGNRNNGTSSSTGGFWTGAATGGLLGYMFGNRGNWGGGTAYHQAPSYGFGRSYASPGFSGGGFQGRPSSSSSGTRTASGFGGTSRR